jgi:hypothetical protein
MKSFCILIGTFFLAFALTNCEKTTSEKKGIVLHDSVPANFKSDECKGLLVIWVDNFDTPEALEGSWRLLGKPKPEWKQEAYGRNGLFDNNGSSPVKNYAITRAMVGRGYGLHLESEILLKILNPEGTCVCPGIALTKQPDSDTVDGEFPTGISMRIVYVGSNAVWFPAKLRNHTWFIMEFISENEKVISSGYIPADTHSNNWYILRFYIASSGLVTFYCDETLLWAPSIRIHPEMQSYNQIVLGYTSDGDPQTRSGVAYHNWVKATYALSPKK